ncbi:MAG: hypothetical protein ABIH01_01895 [Candidatus Omnitrophota bacterium]
MKVTAIILVLILALSVIPSATAAQQVRQRKTYFWQPFTTWCSDVFIFTLTGVYRPDQEADEGRPRPKSNNPWFW